MNFTVTWFNPTKNIYDNFYLPSDYLKLFKARLTYKYNYGDYIDTKLSLSQLHSYNNGFDTVDNIFSNLSDEEKNWIKNINKVVDFSKYKTIVNKVQIL